MRGEEEIWKPVKGYEGLYEISNLGRVKGLPKKFKLHHGGECVTGEKILHPSMRCGYLIIVLYGVDRKRKTFSVHRLVADAFIPNPYNKREVNHKYGNRSDNRSSQLEWVTPSENINHSYKILKRKYSRQQGAPTKIPVIQCSLDGFILNDFKSLTAAGSETGISRFHISQVVKGTKKQAGGYLWL